MNKSSNSKVWFVTGAARGIGARVVEAALAAGDRVLASARQLAHLQAAYGHIDDARIALVQHDVASEQDALDAVKVAMARFGRIDVLVNNAAYGLLGHFEELSSAQIEQQFAVNVHGVMHVLRVVLPVMRAQRAGHVINISSVAGVTGFDGAAVYCASKYAIEGLSASLALELQRFGIAVTAVEPGFFRTDFLDASSVRYGAASIDDYAAHGSVAEAYGAYHGKQLGDPVRLATAIVALAAMARPPRQFLAGSDAVAMTTAALAARHAEAQASAQWSASTDHRN
ncbi:SDR family NAD(P)-dependent oxidoreductase [Massilia sp. PWRC2]|uniref:SDR family NAD(P)-dependent oxidoreductase n=1 Tax=Massilia sp. PWRC2 TaxID=2804626 RepID=UPI003CEC62C6